MLNGSTDGGLVVSLPGSALLDARLTASVFSGAELEALILPPDLRSSAQLVLDSAAAAGRPVRFVARPEIFTHGSLLAGLMDQLDGVQDHLALSDGTSCRLVPGLRNHIFFYRRHSPGAGAQLRTLVAQAPETFRALTSQVNGALAFRTGSDWHRPPLSVLRHAETPWRETPRRLPFLFHPANPAQAARFSLAEGAGGAEGEEAPAWPEAPGALLYVPLAEGVLADDRFMNWLARRMLAAMMGGGERILLELGGGSAVEEDQAAQIIASIHALTRTGIVFPRTPTEQVCWSTGTPPAEALAGATLLVHPGLDFWRLGDEVWRAAGAVRVAQGSVGEAGFATLLRDWLGPLAAPLVERIRPPLHHVTVARTL